MFFQGGGTSQWCPTKFNLYDTEMRNARGFNVWPEVYFSGSENVTEFLEGIDNQIKLLEIPSDLSCAYLKGHLMGRAPGLVPNIQIEVSAKYRHEDKYSHTVTCMVLKATANDRSTSSPLFMMHFVGLYLT
ncbi:uncharacterized protein TNCV_679751 [Trichonephila clavipes]|nr:uncharacterized protein TNCV_679751 [Trichonephila clavipes]